MFSAVFLVLYLQCKLSNLPKLPEHKQYPFSIKWWPHFAVRGFKILLPYAQIGSLAFGIYVGLTRISDYMHHPMDVLTGSVLGSGVAFFMIYIVMNLPNRPRIFHKFN